MLSGEVMNENEKWLFVEFNSVLALKLQANLLSVFAEALIARARHKTATAVSLCDAKCNLCFWLKRRQLSHSQPSIIRIEKIELSFMLLFNSSAVKILYKVNALLLELKCLARSLLSKCQGKALLG
jgi:hypothetical protein